MSRFLPNFHDCVKITENNESFMHKEVEKDGTKIHIFDYRLASYTDFAQPIEGITDIDAFELRGLSFVEKSGGGYHRFLQLHKFFNVNQTIGYMIGDIKNKNIVQVQEKMDGSMIGFVRLNNGKFIPKTRFGIDNIQCQMASEIIEKDSVLSDFIDKCLQFYMFPIFELVAPTNRIVVKYAEPKLYLLQIRFKDGTYLNHYNRHWIPKELNFAPTYQFDSFEDAQEYLNGKEGLEGFVVRFEDGQMVKVKTEWYTALHKLLTEHISSPDYLVLQTLEGRMDDILSELEPGDPDRVRAERIAKAITQYYNHNSKVIRDILQSNTLSRKDFALKNKGELFFGIMMACFDDPDPDKIDASLKDFLIKCNSKMERSKEFLSRHVGLTDLD